MVKYPVSEATKLASGGFAYPPAGRCIYCGSVKQLSREHIVPFGLFGDLILPSGSCESCRIITSKVETFVLQRMLGVHRRKFGYRSQSSKKKRRPESVCITVEEADGSERRIELQPNEYPWHSYALPIFGPPGLTGFVTRSALRENDRLKCVVGQTDAQAMLQVGGGTKPVRMPQLIYQEGPFARFLAKMAHGYATAILGEGAFEPLLKEFIIAGAGDPRAFVGGKLELEPSRGAIFEIALGSMQRSDGTFLLASRIRLLSYLGTPTYTVVVGQGFQDDLAAIEHCAYAKAAKISVVGPDGKPIFTPGF